MSERITEERLRDYLAFSQDEEDEEMVAILTELSERRRHAGYSRDQRLTFLLRLVKDSFPEVANDLREIFGDMNNDIYYSRRDREYWKAEGEKTAAHLRSCLRDAMAFIDPDVAGDYELWKAALGD